MTLQTLNSPDRMLMGVCIGQRSDMFFSLDKLFQVGNLERAKKGLPLAIYADYTQQKKSKEFMNELKKDYGGEVWLSKRGKSGSVWVHPLLFMDIALWLMPNFKVQIYKWLYDSLIKNRISSCDSYKRMCGILFDCSQRKDKFQSNIKALANKIKTLICVDDWNNATSLQLERRDELQNLIADLSQTLQNVNAGVDLAFRTYRKKYLQGEFDE